MIEPGTLCFVWNDPKEGERPRYSIRTLDFYSPHENYKARYVDDHNIYWDNAEALPEDTAKDIREFIKTLES